MAADLRLRRVMDMSISLIRVAPPRTRQVPGPQSVLTRRFLRTAPAGPTREYCPLPSALPGPLSVSWPLASAAGLWLARARATVKLHHDTRCSRPACRDWPPAPAPPSASDRSRDGRRRRATARTKVGRAPRVDPVPATPCSVPTCISSWISYAILRVTVRLRYHLQHLQLHYLTETVSVTRT